LASPLFPEASGVVPAQNKTLREPVVEPALLAPAGIGTLRGQLWRRTLIRTTFPFPSPASVLPDVEIIRQEEVVISVKQFDLLQQTTGMSH
jgi:hypothetical protein